MKVQDLRQEEQGEWRSYSAQIIWEDSDQTPARLEFLLGKTLRDHAELNPDAFLVASAVPAAFYGEQRLCIEGTLDSALHDGVLTVLTQLREWYDKARRIPVIEPTGGFTTRLPCSPPRAAQFFSGGIDALATLRRNRQIYPEDHPSSIRDCLHIFGMHPLDYGKGTACPDRLALWERNLDYVRRISTAADVELHLFRTNAHGVFRDQVLQAKEYHSATLAALAHLIGRRISEVSIASTDSLADNEPYGSHPLVDPYYSSAALRVHHDGARLKRLEKVDLVSEWPEAMALLNVCTSWKIPANGMNCGECEKCVRTILELLICGKLEQAPTFQGCQVDPQLISQVRLRTHSSSAFYAECLEPLKQLGRQDLVGAIEKRLQEYRAWARRKAGYGIKPRLKKFDERILGGWFRNQWYGQSSETE